MAGAREGEFKGSHAGAKGKKKGSRGESEKKIKGKNEEREEQPLDIYLSGW